jgi:hypothetical protein
VSERYLSADGRELVKPIDPELKVKLRSVGPFCTSCRVFVWFADLKPPPGERKVKREAAMALGEIVGRHWCGAECRYVLEDRSVKRRRWGEGPESAAAPEF